MVVAAARRPEAVGACDLPQSGALGLAVLAVVDLDGQEPGADHRLEDLLGHVLAAAGGGGMRGDRDASGLPDRGDGDLGGRRVVAHVVGGAGREDRGEGRAPVGDDARGHEGVGDVRAPQRGGLPRDLLLHLVPGDRVVAGDGLDHGTGAVAPGGAGPLQLVGQRRLRAGVGQQREDVDARAPVLGGDLDAGDDGDAVGARGRAGVVPAGGRVVVGQRDDVQAHGAGLGEELVDRAGAVGVRRVRVQVGAGIGRDRHTATVRLRAARLAGERIEG